MLRDFPRDLQGVFSLLLKVGAKIPIKPRVDHTLSHRENFSHAGQVTKSSEENLPEKSWKFHQLGFEANLGQKGNLFGEYQETELNEDGTPGRQSLWGSSMGTTEFSLQSALESLMNQRKLPEWGTFSLPLVMWPSHVAFQ